MVVFSHDEIEKVAFARYEQRTQNPQGDEDIAEDDLPPDQAAKLDWEWAEERLQDAVSQLSDDAQSERVLPSLLGTYAPGPDNRP